MHQKTKTEVFAIVRTETLAAHRLEDVAEARDGCRDAYTRLILSVESKMYRIARSILRQDADCSDALQEALLRGWKSISRLRDPQLFEPWLMRILVRECYRIAKKRRPQEEYLDARIHHDPDIAWHMDMRSALDMLPEHERIALVMHYNLDYSVKTMSNILKTPEGTVKTWLSRGRKHLIDIWKEDMHEN